MTSLWYPSKILKSGKFALCLLNQPVVEWSPLIQIWNKSCFRVTVDGGTSIWAEIVNNANGKVEHEVPDLITGDFDSADKTHVEHFRKLGSKIVSTPDQDYTDFTKCLMELGAEMQVGNNKLSELEAVFAFVENSGRLDQIMANIETLFHAPGLLPCPVFIMSSHGLSWLLGPGDHEIRVRDLVTEDSHCGLIPLDGQAEVTTSGLKWNLDKGALKFGHLVSTSNGFDLTSENVKISTDKSLLWTMDY